MPARIVFAVAAAAAILVASSAWAGPKVGQVAKPFHILTYNNVKVTSDQLKGQVVLLNFWATWCAPCRNELVVFDRYIRQHPGTDLKIYAVDVDDEPYRGALKVVAEHAVFPLVRRISGGGFTEKSAVPTSFIIDRAGMVRYAEAGAFTEETLPLAVDPLLAEKAPAASPQVGAP